MKIDWNVRIEDGMKCSGTFKVLHAVEGEYYIVFIECGTWEEAVQLRGKVMKQLNSI